MPNNLKLTIQDKASLANVKNILEGTFNRVPSLYQLCRQSGLNADKLKKGFKSVYGYSVIVYHLRIRIAEAKRLLVETELPINEIAWSVGYEYAGNFCTAFKKNAGLSPLQFRKHNS